MVQSGAEAPHSKATSSRKDQLTTPDEDKVRRAIVWPPFADGNACLPYQHWNAAG
jgi:hypothetical protein